MSASGRPDGPQAAGPPVRPSRAAVEELVVDRLAEVLAVRRSSVTRRASLAGDLQADSLDLVEAVESIEQTLREGGHEVRIPESVLASWATVGDVIDGFADAARTDDA